MAIYKDTKRNTWYFRVYIDNEYGKPIQKQRRGFKSKSEAKIEEQKFIMNSKNVISNDILFINLYEDYKKYKKQRIKTQSYVTIINKIEKHIVPFFKEYKIRDINHIVYNNWKEYIFSKGLSFSYNSSLHTCMVSIFNYAKEFYGLEENIASKIGNFKRTTYSKKFDFWTIDEFSKFIKEVDLIEFKTLYWTLFFTGLRLGECLALKWTDFKDNCLHIDKTLAQKVRVNDEYDITTPKTESSNRKVSLDNETINKLNELKEYYKNIYGFSNNWCIFGGIKPLSFTTIRRRKNQYCKKANVKQIKIHDFRHSHCYIRVP